MIAYRTAHDRILISRFSSTANVTTRTIHHMYLLSELKAPNAIHGSLYTTFGNHDTPILISCRIDKLEFSKIHPQESLKTHLFSVYTSNPILAFTKVRYLGNDIIVVLDSTFNILVLYQGDAGMIEKAVTKLSFKGQQQSIDSVPLFAVDNSQDPSYFVLHTFQGVIQLFVFGNTKLPRKSINAKSKKRSKDTDDLWSVSSISIGNVVVLKMVMLKHCSNLLAMLYRTFNFDYALRYYTVDPKTKSVVLTKQFEEFDEPPSCVIPMNQGGILIVSGIHIFYFPNPNIYLTLSDECTDPTVSINTQEGYITKDISGNRELLMENFNTYEIIDDSRVLLVSSSGSAYILNLEATKTNKTFEIMNIHLIKLGMLTIPTAQGLHHIDENYFYQASRTSQSMLFQIFPREPFLHINSFLDSSPPILSIDTEVDNGFVSISTCQGGQHSGEFRRYTSGLTQLKFEKRNPISSDITSFSVLQGPQILLKKVNNERTILNTDPSTETLNLPDCSTIFDTRLIGPDTVHITNVGIFKNTQSIHLEEFLSGKFFGQSLMVTIDKNNTLTLRNQYKVLHSTVLTSSSEIRKMDICETPEKCLILITWWDGLYSIYKTNSDSLTNIWKGTLPDKDGIFSSTILYEESTQFAYVFLLTQDGKLTQFQFDPKTSIKYEKHLTTLKLDTCPLQVAKNGSKVLLFNDSSLFGLVMDIFLGIFAPHKIPFKGSFRDVAIMNVSTIAILSKSSINMYSLSIKKSLDLFRCSTRHSNVLVTKSVNIPRTKYSVVVLQETKIELDTIKKHSYLELIDNSNLKPIHRFSFGKKQVELVDMCLACKPEDEEDGRSFVCLSGQISDPLYTLGIKNNKIVLLSESKVQGISTIADTKLNSISIYSGDDSVYCITGNVNFLVQSDELNDSWTLIPASVSQVPVFAIAHTICHDSIFMGDVMHGLYEAKVSEDYDVKVSKVNLDYKHHFLTSVDSRDLNGKSIVITGDSFGNLSILDVKLKQQKCAFNIGDQINSIKCISASTDSTNVAVFGTVNGGLYKLSFIDDEETCEILESCQKELGAISTPYNNTRKDWKLIQKQESGLYTTKEHFGVIDMRLIPKFLGEKILKSHSKSYSGGRLLKVSSKNKTTLEKILFESSLLLN